MPVITLTHDRLRIRFEDAGGAITHLAVEVGAEGAWERMAESRPVSRTVYRDKAGNRQEIAWQPNVASAGERQVVLRQTYVDGDGVTWQLAARFERAGQPDQVTADYTLECSESRGLLDWVGPNLQAGAGAFGAVKSEALFPGLEYLLGDEPSSDTAFAAEKYANRTVPHPYRVTVPLMAVSHQGRVVGLAWDANQAWGSAWRHPAAQFSSPDRLHPGGSQHWMALSAPAVEPRWRNEAELEAHTPCGGKTWTLSARILGAPSGGVMAALRAWVAAEGLPPLPGEGGDYAANVDLCVRSYLDVAWDEAAEGWHHTLSDPWGPRFEANLANQLWHYGRWPSGDPALRARARDQVRRAVGRAQRADARAVPHLDLALVYGQVKTALAAVETQARAALANQREDGAWPWKPADVAQVADFKTEDRLARMGRAADSSSGFTASRVQPVTAYALLSGDPGAVAAVCRAADWCNQQSRPEGAQTWELHLHVPDVLAAPHLINLNLAAYELTGWPHYLEAANAWAWTGLPFTYLWNAYYRPVMRYGTVPVFGVTFHDVQSWFGVIVQWNGLVYADALYRLAEYCAADGPIAWRTLAEGIVRHGIQEQMTSGPYTGMYPDAFSPVRGDEEYTWWLNPQLIGLNTLPLAGLPVAPGRRVLRDGARAIHITSGAAIRKATFAGERVSLFLADWPGETSYLAAAGRQDGCPLAAPAAVRCEGHTLARVPDVAAVDQGWEWLSENGLALIRLRGQAEWQVEIEYN